MAQPDPIKRLKAHLSRQVTLSLGFIYALIAWCNFLFWFNSHVDQWRARLGIPTWIEFLALFVLIVVLHGTYGYIQASRNERRHREEEREHERQLAAQERQAEIAAATPWSVR